jgi:hypothetical protein
MSSLSSLVVFIPMGVGLLILSAAVVTAVIDSWWNQRSQQSTAEVAVEPCPQRKAA